MRIGMIGLGRMGANMVRRLIKGGHECVVYDRDAGAVKGSVAQGAKGASSLAEPSASVPFVLATCSTVSYVAPDAPPSTGRSRTMTGFLASAAACCSRRPRRSTHGRSSRFMRMR